MKTVIADVAVVGGGPAGMCAALQAARAGAHTILIDENSRPGGQLFKQIHKFFGSRDHKAGTRGFAIGTELLEQVTEAGVEVWLDSLVYGIQKDKTLGVIQNGKNIIVQAKKVILAAGAKENYLAFPGSTLPGVMGAGAAQTMINVNRVLPGERILMLGAGNVGLIVSYQLMQAGAEVAALVEGAPRIGGYAVHAGKLRRAGVPFYLGHTIKSIEGNGKVEKVTIVEVDPKWQPVAGSEKTFEVDTVCLAAGLNPMTELAWMAGCEFTFIPAFGGHVPLHDERMETTVSGLYAAGDITGPEEASSAMEEGNMAGVCAAESLGYLSHEQAELLREEIQTRLNTLRSGMFGERRAQAKQQQIDAMHSRTHLQQTGGASHE